MRNFSKTFAFVLIALLINGLFTSSVYAGKKANKQAEKPKLVKISTLNSIEANQEFQRNVQIMQAQRQALFNLHAQMDKAHTNEMKKELQKRIDAASKKLNEDNKKMVKAYGFSLNRNYVLVVEKAHVYMAVTEKEAAEIAKKEKKSKKIKKNKNKKK